MIKELLPGDAAKRMRPAVTRLSSSRSGLAARLSLLHALTFLSVGVYIPFFPLWLASRGVSDVAIGVLLTIPIVARVLAASGAAGLGDGRVPPVLLLAGLNLAGALFYAAMAAQSDPWVIGLLMALSATATAGVIPLADMLTTAQVRAGAGIDYGRVRLWGSVSFFAANLLGGVVIARQGAGIVPMAMAACFACAALLALAAPSPPRGLSATPTRGAPRAGFGAAFWWAIAAVACINATHGALYAFGSLHWRNLGYSEEAIGGFGQSASPPKSCCFWWRAASSRAASPVCSGSAWEEARRWCGSASWRSIPGRGRPWPCNACTVSVSAACISAPWRWSPRWRPTADEPRRKGGWSLSTPLQAPQLP